LFDHKKTLGQQVDKKTFATLDERLAKEDRELDEQRSMKSEFDYSTKKKFVEMISKQKRFTLPQNGEPLSKEALEKLSGISKKSTTLAGPISLRSNRAATLIAKQLANPETILEAKNEGENAGDGKEALPEATSAPASNCITCAIVLSDDEVTINQRFIDQALTSTDTTSSDVA